MSKCSEKEIREAVSKMIKKKLYKIMKWTGITGTIVTITLMTTLLIQTHNPDFILGYIFATVFGMMGAFGHIEGEYSE